MKHTFLTIALLISSFASALAYDFTATYESGQELAYTINQDQTTVSVSKVDNNIYNNISGDLIIPASVVFNSKTYSVTSIGDYAFHGWGGCLTSVTIPNSVTSIGQSAFYGCRGLTSVTIPESVTSIGDLAFYGCSGLTSVTIPESVTSIGDLAFYGCRGLTSVTILEGVTSIGQSAFYGCRGLTSVTIPNSVTSIGSGAFNLVKNIVYYGEATGSPWGALTVNGTIDGDFVYSNSEKTNLTGYIGTENNNVIIPSSVTSIGDYVFDGCSGLTSVTIPESVITIGKCAFSYCSGLTSVTIPESVTSIGDLAFYECRGLTSVTIPESVTSIGNDAFRGLRSVSIPNSVTSIGNDAFYLVKNIVYYGEATGSPWGALTVNGTIDGDFVYSDSEKTNLTGYIGTDNNVIIPSSVTSIGNYAFASCESLMSVTIPESVTSIGDYAFCGCSGLTSVTILEGVTSIGKRAFYGSGLTSVTIPESVTSIGDLAFSDLTSLILTSLIPPLPRKYIGVVGTGFVFKKTLYVPNEALEAYRNDAFWSRFKNIESFTAENVELTEDEVFVESEADKASFSFPLVESADSYQLTVYENDEINSTFSFNEQGQLTNIDVPIKSGSVQGFLFTIAGLSASTEYTYLLQALDVNKNVLKEYSGSFITKDMPLAVNCVSNATAVTIANNQILINGEAPAFVVTISGKKIANQNLKFGVYFVSVEGETVKVVVK